MKKQKTSRKTSTSASLTTLKPLTVDHNKLWKIIKEIGIPDYLTCLLRNMYAGQEAKVKISECSHEIKRCLLLGRKTTTNLGNILKNRDITLPTNVSLVKAVVYSVVMYSCESWIMNSEGQRIDVFKLWCWIRLLRILWSAMRSS